LAGRSACRKAIVGCRKVIAGEPSAIRH
jgi:hypothetical protein